MEPSLEQIKIPTNQKLPIRDVCKLFNIGTHTIRHWEEKCTALNPRRRVTSKMKVRFFTRKDLEILWCIKYLVNEQGFTLPGADAILTASVKKGLSPEELKETFEHLFEKKDLPVNKEPKAPASNSLEKIEHLQQQIDTYEQKESALLSEIEQKQAHINRLEHTINYLKKQLDDSHKGTSLKIVEQKKLVDSLKKQIEQLQKDLHLKEEKIKQLEEKNTHLFDSPSINQSLHTLSTLEKELHDFSSWIQSF